MDIGGDEIREALGRVLSSETFAASPTLMAFLRYVVEETLAGRGDRLKAYSIAVFGLERPSDFDPTDNPLIRVQARRLRITLGRYYAGPGAHDPLRIDLPIGSYVPSFRRAIVPPSLPPDTEGGEGEKGESHVLLPADESEPLVGSDAAAVTRTSSEPAQNHRRSPALMVALLALGLAFVAVIVAVMSRPPIEAPATATSDLAPPLRPVTSTENTTTNTTTTTTGATSSPTAPEESSEELLPQLAIEVEARGATADWFDPDLYRRRLEAFVLRFDDLAVVTHRIPDPVDWIRRPTYRLHVTVIREGDAVNAYLQFNRVGQNQLLATDMVPISRDMRNPNVPGASSATPDDLAVVRRLIQFSGPMWTELAGRHGTPAALDCLATASRYDVDASVQTLRRGRLCLETVLALHPDLVPALLLFADVNIYEYRRALSSDPAVNLTDAEHSITRALGLAPTSSAVQRRLQHLLLLRADFPGAMAAGRRALELNPHDLATIGDHGLALVTAGHFVDAVPYLRRAIEESRTHPQRIHFYLFLALDVLGRHAEADQAALPLIGTTSPLFGLALAIREARTGNLAAARSQLARTDMVDPQFVTDPRASLKRRGLGDAAVEHLLASTARIRDGKPM